MRRFTLVRKMDITGVSGTGLVAEGIVFTDGTVVMRWLGSTPSTVVHDKGMEAVERIHCHGGNSYVEWMDDEEI